MRKSLLLLFFAIVALGRPCPADAVEHAPTTISHTVIYAANDVDAVKEQLGPDFHITRSEHFAILHQSDDREALEVTRTLESAYTRFFAVFTSAGFDLKDISSPLTWVSFPTHDGLSNYALATDQTDVSRLHAYYSTRTNRVAIVRPAARPLAAQPAGSARTGAEPPEPAYTPAFSQRIPPQVFDFTEVTHELAHQLSFNTGLQKRGVMYPRWVSEGLATALEIEESADSQAIAPRLTTQRRLAQLISTASRVPLDQVITQTRPLDDSVLESQWYAQACALFEFALAERTDQLRGYLAGVSRLNPGRRQPAALRSEFINAFGHPELLESDWLRFIGNRRSQPNLAAAGFQPY